MPKKAAATNRKKFLAEDARATGRDEDQAAQRNRFRIARRARGQQGRGHGHLRPRLRRARPRDQFHPVRSRAGENQADRRRARAARRRHLRRLRVVRTRDRRGAPRWRCRLRGYAATASRIRKKRPSRSAASTTSATPIASSDRPTPTRRLPRIPIASRRLHKTTKGLQAGLTRVRLPGGTEMSQDAHRWMSLGKASLPPLGPRAF